jgi:WD40 repeat protein
VLLVNPTDNHVVQTLQHGSAADARLRWYPRRYLRVAPDDQHFASFTGSRVSVWDVDSRAPTATIEASLFNVSFSATSQYLAVASFDGTARVYDLAAGASEAARLQHGDWVFNATFSSDGRHLLTACRDCRARV